MIEVLLVIHIILALSLVGIVLVQRSEGGALGMGGATMGGLMTTRGSANLLTRATAVVAACFIASSLALAILSSSNQKPKSIIDTGTSSIIDKPLAKPTGPAVPVAK
ncbi:MAG: preprotein translocase subunit SecG [Pseudomonadota bacterium]|nr:preprotein translocase subunit SecG [Pseudomonadota bacterium]